MRASVTISELDLSSRVPSFPGIYGGIVIPAKKGAVDERTLITNETQLLQYMTPDETVKVGYDTSYYSALAFLLKSNKLWAVRAANEPLYGGCFLAQDPPLTSIGVTATNGNDCIVIKHSTDDEIADSVAFFAAVTTAEKVTITSVGGSVPSGLVSGQTYYLIIFNEEEYKVRLALSKEDAIDGVYVDFRSDGSGTLSLNLIGTLANNSIEYGLADPTTYILDSSDGKYAGLSSAFTLSVDNNAFNVSSAFYSMVSTGDTLTLTAVAFPDVGSGAPLDAVTTYYAIKSTESTEIQIARTLTDALNGTEIVLTSVGNTVVGTLSAKAAAGTFTASASTDRLTPAALAYNAIEDGDVVRCSTTGALPIGIGIAEVLEVTCNDGSTLVGGEYFTISSPLVDYYVWYQVAVKEETTVSNIVLPQAADYFLIYSHAGTKYCVWYTLDGAGADPSAGLGATSVPVAALTGDTALAVAVKTAAAIDAVGGGLVFDVPVPTIATIVITHIVAGTCTDAADGAGGAATGYLFTVSRQGVNASGVDPAPAGMTGIPVIINSTDTDIEVASATTIAIAGVVGVFDATAADEIITVTNLLLGETAEPADVDTGFTILTTIEGRGDTTDYYVIDKGITPSTIKLSLTLGGTAIDITSAGSGTHTITLQNKAASSSFVGDLSKDTLGVSATFYGWIASGDAVTVACSAGGTLPTPLVASTTYYVIKKSTNEIKLAATLNDVDLDNPIDLMDAGAGTFTIYNQQNQELLGLERKCLLIYGCNPGDWNNDIYIKSYHYPYGDSSTWTAYQQSMADLVKEPDCFVLYVYKDDGAGNLTLLEGPLTCSRVPGKKDGYGKGVYVEDVLESSNYIRAIDNHSVDSSIYPEDQATILAFAYGDDGGTVTDTHMLQALTALANKRDVFVTLLLDGGWSTPAWQKQGLLDLAETRKDCFAILSVPIAAEQASDYMTEILDYRKNQLNANSSYGALFTSHLYIQDKYNDRKIYVSPDGYVGAAISETASNYEIWYAPAGPRRGNLNVLDVARRFTEGDMDVLYDNGINPVDYYPGRGIRIGGQKTLLARPSALDRINVRLLLITIEPAIAEFLEDFLFEFNDAPTRALVTSGINSYMENIRSRRGVYDYNVICDESNNTPEVIDANEMNVWLFVQPNKTAEFIKFKTIITRTGATMSL